MATLKKLGFLLFVICLCSATLTTSSREVNQPLKEDKKDSHMTLDKKQMFKARASDEETFVKPVHNLTELAQVVNFARLEITNESSLPFKEQVYDVYRSDKLELSEATLYYMQLLLTETKCKIDNSSCDPKFDEGDLLSNQTHIIAPIFPPMSAGKEIKIHGRIPAGSKGFHITIHTGYESPVEAQFRLRANFSWNGTRIQLEYYEGNWNLYSHFTGFLAPTENFKIVIVCLFSNFEIYINNNFFTSFTHVLHYQDATHLSIFGDVHIHKLTGIGKYLPPDKYKPSRTYLDDYLPYVTPPYVPFVAPLAKPLALGKSISIKGVVPTYSERFAITIQTGSDIEPKQAQLRLLAAFSEDKSKEIVSLAYCNGSWQGEHLEDPVLKSGREFHIIIACRPDHFKIIINGKHIARYHYKLPIYQATHLSVLGMVNITEVVGIGEVPRVTFLEKPVLSPTNVDLQDIKLTPGRKLKIWAYILEKVPVFGVHLQDKKSTMNYMSLMFTFPTDGKEGPYIVWNTFSNGNWGDEKRFRYLLWLRQAQPIQIEISCLKNSYQVIFYGIWTYNFDYRLPLKDTAHVRFEGSGALLVHAVDGAKKPTPLPPPPPPPLSRVCSMTVRKSSEFSEDMWLNDLECNKKNQSTEIGNLIEFEL